MNTTSFAKAALLAACVLSAGCGSDDQGSGSNESPAVDGTLCDFETRADSYAADMAKTGETVSVALVDSMPAPPGMEDNVWTVRITDLQGTPIDLVDPTTDLVVVPWMPDHQHGVMADVTVTELAPGEYRIDPVRLPMPGYWEITLDVTSTEGTTDSVMFKFCVQ
jgi:hypothetical protein